METSKTTHVNKPKKSCRVNMSTMLYLWVSDIIIFLDTRLLSSGNYCWQFEQMNIIQYVEMKISKVVLLSIKDDSARDEWMNEWISQSVKQWNFLHHLRICQNAFQYGGIIVVISLANVWRVVRLYLSFFFFLCTQLCECVQESSHVYWDLQVYWDF